MPTYVYECSNCSDVFEVDQRITENALDECHCGSKGTVKRLIQPVAVMFNGAGFHINDYAAKAAPAPAAEKPKAESTVEPSTSAGSEPAKPAATDVTST